MITVRLFGGRGNQMFQYALGRSLALKNRDTLQLDQGFLIEGSRFGAFTSREYDLDVFQLNVERVTIGSIRWRALKAVSRLGRGLAAPRRFGLPTVVSNARLTEFDPSILEVAGSVILAGYWQSPKYFAGIEKELRSDFTIRREYFQPHSDIARLISSTDSVSVHVRRGDFITDPAAARLHGFVGLDYYQEAVALLASRLPNAHLFVTSDDLDWCYRHLRFPCKMTYIGPEHKGYKFSNELWLMSQCKHYIIPNSTFAWWAAWLGSYQGKIVVAPARWFRDTSISTRDLFPSGWVQL